MESFIVKLPKLYTKVYNILDFGAKSDINFNNKKAIQEAIDCCSNNGGGLVLIPNGYYLSGPIQLKSNVNLHLDTNAYLQFTKSKEEYPLIFTEYEGQRRIRAISPIMATNCHDIAITGKGTIDGNGHLWRGIKKFKLTSKEWERCLKKSQYVIETKESSIWCPTKTYYEGVIKGEPDYNLDNALDIASDNYDVYRPVLVSLRHCDKVLIEDVTIQNSPAWNVHPIYCNDFTMRDAKIKNKFSAQNGDGIDLESCTNCEISNTIFEVGDDGICLKSGKNREARQIKAPTKNVWIHDCKVFDAHGGFVVGSEMSRGISNVLVENCTFSGTDIGVRFKSAMGRGGVVEDIIIRNIQMNNIINEAFIFTMNYVLVNIEDEHEHEEEIALDDIPEFRDIHMENIMVSSCDTAIKIQGLKEKPINNLTFKNIFVNANKENVISNAEDIHFDNVLINYEK